MPSPDKVLAPWVDIAAPPVPVDEISWTMILVVSSFSLFGIILITYLWQRPRFKALRQLQQIQKRTDDPRQQLFLLKQVLQQGLQVNQLQQLKRSSTQETAWREFCHELIHACYQPGPPSNSIVKHLILQAKAWLKRH